MANEQKDIAIGADDFKRGSSVSPFYGLGITRNLDIHTAPGVVFSNGKTTKQSGTTITGKPMWFAEDKVEGIVFCLDSLARLYRSTDGGDTWTYVTGGSESGYGNGLALYKGYLFVIHETTIDLYDYLTGSTTWRNNWATINETAALHPTFIGKDDTLYIGSDQYIDAISEVSGQTLTWNNAATYTVSLGVLDLPDNYRISALSEIGGYLMVGASSIIYRDAKIFPWDTISPSFEQPVSIPENGINQMVNSNNEIYVHAGVSGNIYITDTTKYQLLTRIPITRNTQTVMGAYGYPGAIYAHRNRIFIGISSGVANPNPCGVWSVTRDGVVTLEHTISTGEDGSNGALWIGALWNRAEALTTLIGWYDAQSTAQGVDKVNAGVGYASYGAYFDSPWYRVGTPNNKRTFTQIEFQLDRPLETGQGVRVAYRTSLGSSFTTIDTIDYATYAGIQSKSFAAKITSVENLQLRVSLTSGSAGSPRLTEVRLR